METVWHESNEVFFKALGDESQLQALCHMKSHEEFSTRSRNYQLPIIVLSVICGSGNFVSTSFPDNQDLIILGVGVLSIFTSIISSAAQYLKLAEKSEAHRIAYVSWEKFYNNIRFQLSKRREEREDLSNYMTSITNEYQRLQEISPLLPDQITKNILSNKRKIIKQGMNIPVSLRAIKPTSWWGGTPTKFDNNCDLLDTQSDEEIEDNEKGEERKRKKLSKKIIQEIKEKTTLTSDDYEITVEDKDINVNETNV
jgi:hypothetical protein